MDVKISSFPVNRPILLIQFITRGFKYKCWLLGHTFFSRLFFSYWVGFLEPIFGRYLTAIQFIATHTTKKSPIFQAFPYF